MKQQRRFWVILSMVALLAIPVLASGGAGAAAPAAEEPDLTTKMMFLALQIGFILFAAKLGGMFATLCKMPSVLGELASGVVIGPYALGGLGIGTGLLAHGIFPVPAASGAAFPVTTELYGICTIASVILLFLSGIETDLKMFLRYSVAGTLVGLGGVIASFFFGDLCTVYLLPHFIPSYAGITMFSPPALFMGIMGTATSVGITARILSERKAMDTEEGVTIMAGAVIDDVLGIIVLAIGMGIIQANAKGGGSGNHGVNWISIGKIAAQAFGIWLGGTVFGILAARKISWLLKLFKSPVAVATLAFGLSLVLAGLFQAMGLTLIIGAYVMGLALSRTDIRYLVQENLQSVYTFLVPIFFCVMGMMVDCSKLTSQPVLIFGGIYTVLAILAKVIGCSIPSFFCGFNTLGAVRIGTGMIPRGEVALIIAGIGLSMGYLTADVFGIGILMTLITTIVAPPLLVGLFDIKKRGVRHERESVKSARPISFSMPTDSAAALMMDDLIKAFRSEGFFTALLNPAEDIWQVSKDATEITCSRQGNELRFECTRAEEEFLATAIMEVVSRLHSLSHDLSRPIQTGQIAAIIKDEKKVPIGNELNTGISRCLRDFVMIPQVEASSYRDLIEKITNEMYTRGLIKDLQVARNAIMEREMAMSTGLNHGLAVPHGRTDAVNGLVGAVALVKNGKGIPGYDTVDHQPVRIIVLTIASESGTSPHLQVMAYLSRLLREPTTSSELLKCTTEGDMLSFLLTGKKDSDRH